MDKKLANNELNETIEYVYKSASTKLFKYTLM